MKIRTVEMLSDFLSHDLAWRKKELTDIRRIFQLSEHSTRRKALTRCGIALLYAHFEGFTKQAGRAYLEFIATQRLKNSEISSNLRAVTLRELLSSVESSRKPSAYHPVVDLFENQDGARAKIPYKTAIDTESNLSSRVLREIIFILGLDYSAYESKQVLIDSKLLGRRNHIAHGESLDIDDDDYDDMHNSVITLLNCLRNQIESAASSKSYVKAVQQAP